MFLYKNLRAFLIAILALLINTAYASPDTPYAGNIQIKGLTEHLSASAADTITTLGSGLRPIAPITVEGRILGKSFRIRFTRQKTFSLVEQQPLFFQGDVSLNRRSHGETFAASAMLSGEKLTVNIILPDRQSRKPAITYRLKGIVGGDGLYNVTAFRVPHSAAREKVCANDQIEISDQGNNSERQEIKSDVDTLNALRILYIRPFGDAEFLGGRSIQAASDDILNILNTADSIAFQSQLGLAIQLMAPPYIYTVNPSNLNATESFQLLQAFSASLSGFPQDYNKRGLFHLFTGKDMDGSVVGLACVGTSEKYGKHISGG